MNLIRVIVLFIAVLLAACSSVVPPVPPPPIDVTFNVAKTDVAIGEPIHFTAVFTNTTTQELIVTYALVGGGAFQQGMQRLKPEESMNAKFQDLEGKVVDEIPMTFTVEAADLSPPFKMSELITITVR